MLAIISLALLGMAIIVLIALKPRRSRGVWGWSAITIGLITLAGIAVDFMWNGRCQAVPAIVAFSILTVIVALIALAIRNFVDDFAREYFERYVIDPANE